MAEAPLNDITKALEQETTASESPLCLTVYRDKNKMKVGRFPRLRSAGLLA